VKGVILLCILRPRVLGHRMQEEGAAFQAFQIRNGRPPIPPVAMEGNQVCAEGAADLAHEAYLRLYQSRSPVGRRVTPTVQLVTSTVRRSPGRFVPFWKR
jgi:hypothetical protein